MKRTALLMLLSAMCLAVTGCTGRIIKETIGLVRGAKGVVSPIEPVGTGPAPLAQYTQYELQPLSTDKANNVPDSLLDMLPQKFEQALANEKLAGRSGGKTLIIRGDIWYYESAGMVDNVFGPFEEAIARLELVDKSTGQVLGRAYCIGRTTESVNLGIEKKADGLGKSIATWIRENTYPKK